MEVLLNDSIPLSNWKDFLSNNEYSTPFQSPEFYHAHKNLIGRSAIALALAESDSLISLVVISLQKEHGLKGYFSRRGIIYGGPLISEKSEVNLDLLLEQIDINIKRRSIYLEVRNFSDYGNLKQIFQKHGWEYIPHFNVGIDLSMQDRNSLLLLYNYNRRRQIGQSIENGASTVICEKDQQVQEVYQILESNYKDRVKLPLPDLDFFLSFYHTESLKVFAVLHRDKIIGGAFCPVLENRSLFTFYTCGLRNYHKKIFPTHLAILAAMEYCVDNKIPHFDFMGAGKPGVDYGVRKYKLEFGGDLVEFGRFLKINNHLLYKIGELGIKLKNYFVK